ncbi:hypothetical protein LCGC14_2914210, partial [marine sediment metagenome]
YTYVKEDLSLGEKLHIGQKAMLLIPDLLLLLMVGIVFEKMIADYYGNILYQGKELVLGSVKPRTYKAMDKIMEEMK